MLTKEQAGVWGERIVVGIIIVILFNDLILVGLFQVSSISARVWLIETVHPDVAVFGAVGLFLIAYWLRSNWVSVALVMLADGHLFLHW